MLRKSTNATGFPFATPISSLVSNSVLGGNRLTYSEDIENKVRRDGGGRET